MKSIITKLIIMSVAVLLFSCKKEQKKAQTETPTGSIAISKPNEQQVFSRGDTIHIDAVISANTQLHGYGLFIVTAEGDTILKKDGHMHQDIITVHEEWVNTLSIATTLKVVLSTKLDHHGNNLQKLVTIQVK